MRVEQLSAPWEKSVSLFVAMKYASESLILFTFGYELRSGEKGGNVGIGNFNHRLFVLVTEKRSDMVSR